MCTRCALHGLIYLWDLKSTTKSLTEDTKKDKIIEKEVKEEVVEICSAEHREITVS